MCSLTFDSDGLVKKYTIGYVVDRSVGNTGGLGGPDWLWLMPRHVAEKALTSAGVFERCAPDAACCQLQATRRPWDCAQAMQAGSVWRLSLIHI